MRLGKSWLKWCNWRARKANELYTWPIAGAPARHIPRKTATDWQSVVGLHTRPLTTMRQFRSPGTPAIPAGEKIEGQFARCSICSSFEHLIEQLANGAMRFADGCTMIWRAG